MTFRKNDLVIYYLLFPNKHGCFVFLLRTRLRCFRLIRSSEYKKLVLLSSNLVLQILHIIVLVIWKNYYVYVGATVITTLVNNVILSFICNKNSSAFKKIKTKAVEIEKKLRSEKRILSTFYI